MPFNPIVNGAGGFNATVNGQAAFLASMSAVGIKGDTGATGPAGISSVVSPLSLDELTRVLSIDPSYKPNPFDQSLNTTDEVGFRKVSLSGGSPGSILIDPYWTGSGLTHTVGSNVVGFSALDGFSISDGTNTASFKRTGITFWDGTVQTTAAVSPDLSGYATKSWVTSQGYITSSALAPYETSAHAAANYYPLSSNPAGYITSLALAPYETSAHAAANYYPLSSNPAGYALSSALGTAAYQNIAYFVRSPSVAGTDTQLLSWDAATSLPKWVDAATGTVFTTGTNKTGSTLTKGTIVYINGAQGSKFTLAKAIASGDATSAQTLGVVQSDIANNAEGRVITFGEISGINTSAYADGEQLYLSPGTAGAFTATKPSAPDHLVYVAVVSYSHAINGKVLVKVQNGYELEELHNVAIASVADKHLLVYESSTALWKNKSFSTLDLLTATTAASIYQTLAGMSSYLTSATAASTYQTQAGMSSYLTSATAASTYQTQAGMSSYAALSSPTFSGTPSLPTGTTGVTQTTGNSTTRLATTAFVQQEVPSASTSTAGKVALATDAQTTAATSTTVAVTPSNLSAYGNRTGMSRYNNNTWSGATSGTGALTQQTNETKLASAPTSAVGYATIIEGWQTSNIGSSVNAGFDWSKRIDFVCRYNRQIGTTDSNSLFRILVGRSTTGYAAAGDLTARGIGVRCVNGSAMQLHVHNGTTLTNVTSSHTPTTNTTYELRLLSDGAGNVTLYIDGTQVATTASGPSSGTVSGGNGIALEAENIGTVSGTKAQVMIGNYQVTIGA